MLINPYSACYYLFMRISVIFRIVFFCISTFGLVARFLYNDLSVLAYFTIQANLFIWGWWMISLVFGKQLPDLLIFHSGFKGAMLLYIITAGLLYQVLLAGSIDETSAMQSLLLQINHGITPIAFLIDWIFFTPRERIIPKYLFLWLLYPAIYLLISILYGAGNGIYLYSFLDINRIGVLNFLFSMAGMMIYFILLSGLILFTHNALCRRNHSGMMHN